MCSTVHTHTHTCKVNRNSSVIAFYIYSCVCFQVYFLFFVYLHLIYFFVYVPARNWLVCKVWRNCRKGQIKANRKHLFVFFHPFKKLFYAILFFFGFNELSFTIEVWRQKRKRKWRGMKVREWAGTKVNRQMFSRSRKLLQKVFGCDRLCMKTKDWFFYY